MIIRPLKVTDVTALHHNCYTGRPLREVQDHLTRFLAGQKEGRLVCLVAEVDGQAVATGQLTLLPGARPARRAAAEIGSLVVAPAYRRQGIGTALIRALIEQARQRRVQTLEIAADVDRPWLRAWYERLGFTYQREHDFPGQRVALLTMDLTEGDPT